ncbi:MAG: N-acetylmuramoyl-L-alanine amidase [Bacteroidales bacterium]|nr:N-acetylmuramoyl-L-alanine amidase [Bacteroidales bacterium]
MPYKFKVLKILLCGLLFLTPLVPLQAQDVDDVSRIRRVVIDAGHGGKDPGAISRNGKYKEKNITLSVALELGELIKSNFPDIKVIYTRSTDKYVELSERAAIANRNKADLFISIHVNSAKSTQARGTETFVMGTHKSEANFEVCKLENSVIVIEEDYEKKYEGFNPGSPESYIIFSLLQNVHQEQSIKYAAQVQGQFARGPISVNRGVKQGGLLVLWKTTMPAVLTELGFISNPKDCAVLVTKKGQEQFARGLFNAFVAYKKDFEKIRREEGSGRNVAAAEKAAPVQKSVPAAQKAPAQGPVAAPKAADEFYAVQILSVGKVLGKNAYDLKGRKDTHYIKAGKLYKYYVGRYASRKEAAAALPGIRKSFPGAFVIHIKDNVIIQ